MDDNVPFEAEAPAPEQEATAAPETVETTPEDTQAEQEAPRTFTQEELDAIVSRRLAKEQRKWQREQAQRQTENPSPARPATEDLNDYASPEEYAEALAERKAEELLAKRETARREAEMLGAYHDREEEVREKYDDFEQVAYNRDLPVTEHMRDAIIASEIGPELLYWLGTNIKDARRIAALPPLLQAKEIGKMEAQLAAEPPVRKTSTAPAPIAPVTARSTGATVYDTTDPRSLKTMTTSEWIEAERQRQMKRYEAHANR